MSSPGHSEPLRSSPYISDDKIKREGYEWVRCHSSGYRARSGSQTSQPLAQRLFLASHMPSRQSHWLSVYLRSVGAFGVDWCPQVIIMECLLIRVIRRIVTCCRESESFCRLCLFPRWLDQDMGIHPLLGAGGGVGKGRGVQWVPVWGWGCRWGCPPPAALCHLVQRQRRWPFLPHCHAC